MLEHCVRCPYEGATDELVAMAKHLVDLRYQFLVPICLSLRLGESNQRMGKVLIGGQFAVFRLKLLGFAANMIQ